MTQLGIHNPVTTWANSGLASPAHRCAAMLGWRLAENVAAATALGHWRLGVDTVNGPFTDQCHELQSDRIYTNVLAVPSQMVKIIYKKSKGRICSHEAMRS